MPADLVTERNSKLVKLTFLLCSHNMFNIYWLSFCKQLSVHLLHANKAGPAHLRKILTNFFTTICHKNMFPVQSNVFLILTSTFCTSYSNSQISNIFHSLLYIPQDPSTVHVLLLSAQPPYPSLSVTVVIFLTVQRLRFKPGHKRTARFDWDLLWQSGSLTHTWEGGARSGPAARSWSLVEWRCHSWSFGTEADEPEERSLFSTARAFTQQQNLPYFSVIHLLNGCCKKLISV